MLEAGRIFGIEFSQNCSITWASAAKFNVTSFWETQLMKLPIQVIHGFIPTIFALLIATIGTGLLSADEPKMHKVMADGHPLAVWEKTAESPKAVVLLLHGRTWSSVPDFDLQVDGEELSLMDGLVERGYAVYALDARGYGKTPRDESGWLTPDRASKDVAVVLKWLAERHPKLKPPVLFGWSMGSMVAQLCGQRNPKLMSGVVLFGYPFDPANFLRELTVGPEPTEPKRRVNTAEAAASDFITPNSISQKAIDAYVKSCLAFDPVRVDWRDQGQWVELDPAKLNVPVLLIQAEFDPLAKTDTHARFFTKLATSDRQWVVIPGGDHAAFMETPRPLFLHVLGSFIDRWEK
jgi:alpha-beta hydrolase superfamily lysophospholipase